LDPCSRDEVLAPDLILPPKSKSITRSREMRFEIVVIKATRLIGPIKPDMRSVYNSRLVIEAKTARPLTYTDEGYHIETLE
jgi:hypothetical protein